MADPFDSFVDKWQQRNPEMQLLEPFCPPAGRRRLRAWGALLHELTEAMFSTTDPGVARTKLAWWGEDLAAGVAGVRHPVGRALLAELDGDALAAIPWRPLATAAIDLSQAARFESSALPPAEPARAFGERLADVEQHVFGRPSDPAAVGTAVRFACWLPSLADAADMAAIAEPARMLLHSLPSADGLCLFRSGRIGFDRWRLRRLLAGVAPATVRRIPAWRALLLAWHAGRASRA